MLVEVFLYSGDGDLAELCSPRSLWDLARARSACRCGRSGLPRVYRFASVSAGIYLGRPVEGGGIVLEHFEVQQVLDHRSFSSGEISKDVLAGCVAG